MGLATEPAVGITAISSLALFSCYFAHVLVGVPQHWGVPYKDRLSRHLQSSLQGKGVEVLNATFSLATCVLFILETYEYGSDYNFIVRSFSLELAFNGFFLCNFLLHFYLATGKLAHLVSLQAIVDIITVFPSYLLLFVDDGSQTSSGDFTDVYLGLKVTRVIRVARLLVTISVFVQERSLAFDHSRQVLVLRSQFVRWSLKTLVALFILAGLTNFLVEVQNADWGAGHGNMPFHDALYYIVVSFSTVGYGDISPSTPLSRLLITALILSLFFCAPLVTNALINLTRITPKHGGRLSKSCTGHIVVGCDSSCLRVVSVLLRELLAPDSMAYHTAHVVVVVPQEPTLAWEALLCLQPSFAVTYLTGDLSSAEDLRRARVGDARACFVLSDRLAADTEAQDKTALVRGLCAHQASPPGASVLCLVTHSKSKRRLVRLGVPEAGVVCYDDVMEALVAHACLQPGFSTVWASMLSCMSEAEHLLKARAAEQDLPRSPEEAIVFETEGEYLRSLQRVMIRFPLDAFAGECAGDVAVELHRECGCTLFALICTAASCSPFAIGHEGGRRRDTRSPEQRCARVHPDYGEILRNEDVGVFIGTNNMAADVLARYCSTRSTRESKKSNSSSTVLTDSTVWTGRSEGMPRQSFWSRNRQRVGHRVPERKRLRSVGGAEPQEQRRSPRRPSMGGTSHRPQEERKGLQSPPNDAAVNLAPFSGSEIVASSDNVEFRGSRSGSRIRSRSGTSRTRIDNGRSSRSVPLGGGGGDGASERTVWSQLHGSGHLVPSVSPLGVRLTAPAPGVVLVIAQSLSFALGVIIALCDADVDFEGGSSAVTVLCPPAWWDLTVDGLAERELAERFPSVRLHKEVAECSGLLECGIGGADLVCIVSSRVSENHEMGAHRYGPMDSNGGGGLGFGDHSGRGQGSDGWAMGVVVDVLGLAPASTRVVVRFDDSTSAEQHQVISAHVRRRAVAREREQWDRAWEHLEEERCRQEKGETEVEVDKAPALGSFGESSAEQTARWWGSYRKSSGTIVTQGSIGDSTRDRGATGVYFDDTRGVIHEGFHDFFATMSGYASGDVVIGNAAELLLLQTMLASDIQCVMNDVLDLACRVPIEALWPEDTNGGLGDVAGQSRPKTYGEAYKTLLQDRDLLALGVHRPPIGCRIPTGNESRHCCSIAKLWPSAGQGCADAVAGKRRGAGGAGGTAGDGDAAGVGDRRRCPGGSRYVAINCPSANFVLRDGDCLFVLRRPGRVVVDEPSVIEPAVGREIARTDSTIGIAPARKGAPERVGRVNGEGSGTGPRAATLDNGLCSSTVAAAAGSAATAGESVVLANGGVGVGHRGAGSNPNRQAVDRAMSPLVEVVLQPLEGHAPSNIAADGMATVAKVSKGQHGGAGAQPGDGATVA